MNERITLKTLALSVHELSQSLNHIATHLEDQIGDLARMTANRFDSLEQRVDSLEGEMREGFEKVRSDIFTIRDTYATKESAQKLTKRVEVLEN
jgi:hypothetical protein